MDIKEEINNDLKIEKIKMSCDCKIKDKQNRTVTAPLCSSSFQYLVIGSSGSGKTNLVINLLKKTKPNAKNEKLSYYNMFDHIVVVSPSLKTIDNPIFNSIDPSKIFDSLNEEVFDKIEELQDDKKQILVVMDDVSTFLKDKIISKKLTALSRNRRHLNVSLIIISHKISDFSPSLRNNSSLIFLFPIKNKKESEFLFNEFINLSRKDFNSLIKYVYKDKHDFLLIDTSLRDNSKFAFYRNFNKLIF